MERLPIAPPAFPYSPAETCSPWNSVGRAASPQRFAHLHDVRVEPHIADKLPRPQGLQQFLFAHHPIMLRYEVGQRLEHFGAQRHQDPGVVQLIALGIKTVRTKHIGHSGPFLRRHGTALAVLTRLILYKYYENTRNFDTIFICWCETGSMFPPEVMQGQAQRSSRDGESHEHVATVSGPGTQHRGSVPRKLTERRKLL